MLPSICEVEAVGIGATNNECFEPYTSNIYTRRVLSGEFIVVNKYLLRDLVNRGLWDTEMKDKIITANGSIQDIEEIPADVKELYKTVWEIKMRSIIDMAADRGAYVCQSQSLNLFINAPNASKLTSMHFYAWKKGLKTGMYYLRTQAASQAVKFTVENQGGKNMDAVIPEVVAELTNDVPAGTSCSMEEGCVTCSA